MNNNIQLLRLMALPVFSNVEELADLIHIRPETLTTFVEFPHKFYRRYTIAKRKSGVREIRQPRKDLKGIQAWILDNILNKLAHSPYATAYIKQKNILDNVSPHRNNRYFVCIDLEDFFPSISIRRVAQIFSLIGYSKKASFILARLCTCHGTLPQGAVTSPSLSNLIAAKLDRRIAGYASRRNITYTRYSDDITLSSNNRDALCKSVPRILNIIKAERFKLNMSKLRVLGPRRKCLITGLVKNSSEAKFGIGKKKKRHIRAVIHHAVFGLPPDDKYTSETSIIGWLRYLHSVDLESYEQMIKYWEKLKEKQST